MALSSVSTICWRRVAAHRNLLVALNISRANPISSGYQSWHAPNVRGPSCPALASTLAAHLVLGQVGHGLLDEAGDGYHMHRHAIQEGLLAARVAQHGGCPHAAAAPANMQHLQVLRMLPIVNVTLQATAACKRATVTGAALAAHYQWNSAWSLLQAFTSSVCSSDTPCS